ncbi:MAG: M12 family metallopeptidase [Pseudonocardiaceae bacterium]
MNNEDRLRETLATIAKMAHDVAGNGGYSDGGPSNGGPSNGQEPILVCAPKALPARLLVQAAQTATRVNPVNAPFLGPLASVAGDLRIVEPQHIAVLTSKYWGATARQLTVSFMDTTPADVRARIISHMNAWTKTGCISFVETGGVGQVRISMSNDGYWSYLGTDILHIPKNRQTMNLQGFTMKTPESEYHRVIRHETGHTLGFPHEHMRRALVARIDPDKAYEYFLRTQGWDKQTVDEQVLTPLDERSLMSTPADQTSIMCYQLPGSITHDGKPIVGGLDIDQTDYEFAGKIYPNKGQAPAGGTTGEFEDEWDESEDVEVGV